MKCSVQWSTSLLVRLPTPDKRPKEVCCSIITHISIVGGSYLVSSVLLYLC